VNQRGTATPHYLDTYAHHDEGRQPYQHVGALLTERSDSFFGKAVTQVDGRRDRDEPRYVRAT
jgi:hypothetical protein